MNTQQRDIEAFAARRIVLSGRVQGVGFRPFVYRIARASELCGWVRNDSGQVVIHIEGGARRIERFEYALLAEAPPLARPRLEVSQEAAIQDLGDFRILISTDAAQPDIHLPPDLFCCDDCVAEFQNRSERRYRYPFTNCTQCGPRYTIIEALPYDRPNTSMAAFALCARCQEEYEKTPDRRFHAQPLACPDCGPVLTFVRRAHARERGEDALAATVRCLRDGGIVAVKGVGGYHLMCDPANDATIRLLRERKHRPHKPLAVMFPQAGADGLAAIREHVNLTREEADACADPVRPIVLARRRTDCRLSAALAPGLGELGVFLPYSPLHHLLLSAFGDPLVATSGNISGEPVITDNAEAEVRLAAIADAFLHHDRRIVRPADDSVVRIVGGVPRPIRVGRGMAPLEIELPHAFEQPTLAVGGHMKGAIALGWGKRVVVSPHIGELDSPRSLEIFERVIADLQALYRVTAERIVGDAHPEYGSSRWAAAQGLPVARVQHHAAHASALAGEHTEISRWLMFAWDGVGLGEDGDLWGGEALLGSPGAWRRVASLRRFHVLGGDHVGREPWRSAAALMWETGRDWKPSASGANLALQAWRKRIGTAQTSSVGRLFDAAASLLLGIEDASFEGQGPMMLESLATAPAKAIALPLTRDGEGVLRADWEPLLPMLCDGALSTAERAGIFQESLAQMAVRQALVLSERERFDCVGLTGGVFQNRFLAERVTALLSERGFRAHLPAIVPVNDGGLAFGQLIEVLGMDCSSRAISGGGLQ
jgi:hydrogenase maturation protein HypF